MHASEFCSVTVKRIECQTMVKCLKCSAASCPNVFHNNLSFMQICPTCHQESNKEFFPATRAKKLEKILSVWALNMDIQDSNP